MEDHTIKSIESFRKDLKRHFLMAILFIVLHFVILLIGGLIFFYIEHCYDATPPVMDALTQNYFKFCQLMESVTLQDNQTLQEIGNTTNVTLIKNSLDTCKLDKLQFQGLTCKLNSKILFVWTDYVHTIAFTIGYGAIVTRSQTGRLVTIFYAIPAISITMAMNIFIGNIFVDCSKILIVLFYTKMLKRKAVSNLSMKVFACQSLLSVFLCIVNGYQCQKILFRETITLIDGIYYSFVNFSTIGFGDIYIGEDTPGQTEMEAIEFVYIMITFYIGMGVVASALSGLSEIFTEKREKRNGTKQIFREEDMNNNKT